MEPPRIPACWPSSRWGLKRAGRTLVGPDRVHHGLLAWPRYRPTLPPLCQALLPGLRDELGHADADAEAKTADAALDPATIDDSIEAATLDPTTNEDEGAAEDNDDDTAGDEVGMAGDGGSNAPWRPMAPVGLRSLQQAHVAHVVTAASRARSAVVLGGLPCPLEPVSLAEVPACR